MPDPVLPEPSASNAHSLAVSDDAYPVTPSDADALAKPCRALRATVAGNIKVKTGAGLDRVLAFADGETRYVYVTKVYATGTTATGIEGMT